MNKLIDLYYGYNIISSHMRYQSDHKDKTHKKIICAASKLFRAQGYNASGIGRVMRSVGLTVGGFYNHFDSKESLLLEALENTLNETRHTFTRGLEKFNGPRRIYEMLRRYLSPTHRDNIKEGCPLPALCADFSRQSPFVKQQFEMHLKALLDDLGKEMPAGPSTGMSKAERSMATIALAVGGISLARAVSDESLSNRILMACRQLGVPELDSDGNPVNEI